jgi:hypothetical protein
VLGDVFGLEMEEVATRCDSVRPIAAKDRKQAAGTVRAASNVVADASTKSSSVRRADSKFKAAASAPLSRAAATAKTPTRTGRQGANKDALPQPVDATRKTRAAPAEGAVKRKKRKRDSRTCK